MWLADDPVCLQGAVAQGAGDGQLAPHEVPVSDLRGGGDEEPVASKAHQCPEKVGAEGEQQMG